MYKYSPVAGRQAMSVTLLNAVVNNALFHSNSHTNQMLPQNTHILRFCLVDSVRSGLLVSLVATNLEVHIGHHDILDYSTFGLQAVNDDRMSG